MNRKRTANTPRQKSLHTFIVVLVSLVVLVLQSRGQVPLNSGPMKLESIPVLTLGGPGTENAFRDRDNTRASQVSGRMVFSRNPINPTAPANLTDRFSAGDPIYAAILLNGPLRNFVTDQSVRDSTRGFSVTRPGLEIDFQIDDTPLFDGTTKFVFQLDKMEGALEAVPEDNFLIFDISPTSSNARTYSYPKMHFPLLAAVGRPNNKARAGAQYYSFHIGKLQPGNHSITLTVTGTSKITGRFTITGANYAYYTGLANDLDSVAASSAQLPKSEWNNPPLERSVAAAFRTQAGERVLKTILVSPAWFIQRNSLGLTIHRGLFAVVLTRTSDGKCYMQKEYFKEPYQGRAYGRIIQDGRSETRQLINCPSSTR